MDTSLEAALLASFLDTLLVAALLTSGESTSLETALSGSVWALSWWPPCWPQAWALRGGCSGCLWHRHFIRGHLFGLCAELGQSLWLYLVNNSALHATAHVQLTGFVQIAGFYPQKKDFWGSLISGQSEHPFQEIHEICGLTYVRVFFGDQVLGPLVCFPSEPVQHEAYPPAPFRLGFYQIPMIEMDGTRAKTHPKVV